ncbi:MAG: hypothetical protein V2A64_01180 [Candidatus Omnitrophota bacterium]
MKKNSLSMTITTTPAHKYLKIGTLSSILNDIAAYLKIDKGDLIKELF